MNKTLVPSRISPARRAIAAYCLPLLAAVTLLPGCSRAPNREAPPPPRVTIGMANPADVYCTQIGGTLSAKTNDQGQYSICTLPNGESLDSWALFRRDHPVQK